MKKQYDFRHGRRGAVVRAPSGKTRITIRIDDDILQWFREQVHKAGGGNYQTLINDALRSLPSRSNITLKIPSGACCERSCHDTESSRRLVDRLGVTRLSATRR